MNYRHAFHAGSHIDVFKHAVLALLILHLRKKPKPFIVLDTHAGIGSYDLRSDEAGRTGEAAEGISIALDANLPTAAPYLDIVRAANPTDTLTTYPGSPSIIAALLRPEDRLIACELHPEDYFTPADAPMATAASACITATATKRSALSCRRQSVAALSSSIRPSRRPTSLASWAGVLSPAIAMADGHLRRLVSDQETLDLAPLFERLEAASLDKAIAVEFMRHPEDGVRLAGSGLVILNPPWGIEEDLTRLVDELRAVFGAPEQRTPVRNIAAESVGAAG